MKKTLIVSSFAVLFAGLVVLNLPGQEKSAAPKEKAQKADTAKKPRKAAINRTRTTVKMLDDIYKQTIVLITDKYVDDVDDYPAGSAAVELFRRFSKTGYHQVRLIDATGQPYEETNVAKTEFEKEALKQIKAGESFYDQVVTKDGKPYLLAMTPVPVVMDRCIMCHPHYEDAKKKGEVIGAISYEMPIR